MNLAPNVPHTYVIAEAGVNHNGSIALARELVDAARAAGADAIKFQTFKSERLVSAKAGKAEYQKSTTGAGTQVEMLKALELSAEAFSELSLHARKQGIEFLSSAFDEESLALIVSLGVKRLKLGSGELTNGLMLHACGRTRLPLILSTGMATIGEIRDALGLLSTIYLEPDARPDPANWARCLASKEEQEAVQERITLLHCTTEYPCPMIKSI